MEDQIKTYTEIINEIRQKDLNDDVVEEYANLDPFITRTLVGENLLESSFALRDKEPQISKVLLTLGTSFLELANKEINVKEKLRKAISDNPDLLKLIKD